MSVIISDDLKEKLERIEKREWWPVALLAEVLGCSKKFIYKKIDTGDFDVICEIGFFKISSISVIKYFKEKYMQKV